MANSELLEPETTLEQALKEARPVMDSLAENASRSEPERGDLADDAELAHVQEQLRLLNAKAEEIEAQATRLQQESNGNESTEAEHARQQAQAMRGAAQQASAAIASASTDPKTGKKRISSAKIGSLSGLIDHIIGEAEHEVSALGEATAEARSHSAKRSYAKPAQAAKSTVFARVHSTLFGSKVSDSGGHNAHGREEEDDEPEFHPTMNPRDRRNHDGHVSGREIVGGAVGVARAIGSRRKRATARRVVGEISTASAHDDQRGMLDGSLHLGRGVARVTGSDDVGHVATVVVGTAVTKSNTAGNLITSGDGWGLFSAAGRNLAGMWEAGTDAVGLNSLANEVRPHLGRLLSDSSMDWEHLVNARGVKQFDTDGNGRIDASEVLQVLRNNHIGFEQIDTNHDGHINYAELTAQLRTIAVRNHAHVEGAPAAGHTPSATPRAAHPAPAAAPARRPHH